MGAEAFSSPDTLTRVVFFLLPGLIGRWAWKAVVVSERVDEKTEILRSLVASAWLQVPLVPLLYSQWGHRLAVESPITFLALLFAGLFVLPIAAGLLAANVKATRPWKAITSALNIRSPEPRAWDAFFARRDSCFVRVNFEDGEVIGALLHADSIASNYPASEDLFVEATYYLDPETKRLTNSVPQTRGAWIDMKKVKYLEFFAVRKMEASDVKEPSGSDGKQGSDDHDESGHDRSDTPIAESSRAEGQ